MSCWLGIYFGFSSQTRGCPLSHLPLPLQSGPADPEKGLFDIISPSRLNSLPLINFTHLVGDIELSCSLLFLDFSFSSPSLASLCLLLLPKILPPFHSFVEIFLLIAFERGDLTPHSFPEFRGVSFGVLISILLVAEFPFPLFPPWGSDYC